ncbi:hypothetical protein NLX65_03885 [Candidatus Cardinium sp. TP]|nr:hypothetical protein [Candidatus Cardinium sp. TP]
MHVKYKIDLIAYICYKLVTGLTLGSYLVLTTSCGKLAGGYSVVRLYYKNILKKRFTKRWDKQGHRDSSRLRGRTLDPI